MTKEPDYKNVAPEIIGSKFLLRGPKQSDIADRLKIGKSGEYVRMCGGDTRNMKPLTKEQMEKWYKSMLAREYAWIIEFEGKCIGGLRLFVNHEDKNAMLAIGIYDEKKLNIGIGTETTGLILDYAFNCLNLHRIMLRVLEYNKRAIACYSKAGFKIEGILRENAYIEDKWENDLMMGILKSEFIDYKSKKLGRTVNEE